MRTEMLRLALVAWAALSVGSAVPAVECPAVAGATVVSEKAGQKAPPEKRPKSGAATTAKAGQRTASLHAIMERLGLGEGAAVADIGAGNGRDSWVFAEIVGPHGAVYSEEIVEKMVDSLKKEAQRREFPQLHAILGRADDPCLPPDSVDLAYMHYVYHHFSKPREMLRGLWRGLKPGGYLVIVDRHRGTLRDWVPREVRAKKHYWLAETTVVREAREEGFAFVECAEDCWPDEDQFVLVFQRPKQLAEPGRDPDPFAPLRLDQLQKSLLPAGTHYQRPVFIALGEARKLIGPITRSAVDQGVDVVLEEWATQKDERPPVPPGVSLPSVLTESGDPHLGPEPVDVVFFLDTYHLLFHRETLLAKLKERLTEDGRVYVLDRKADAGLSRRQASHRRRISPQTVKEEMKAAGFCFRDQLSAPAADRFLLVFGKKPRGDQAR